MNRESLLEMCVGITIGLVIVVVAAFRSKKAPSNGVLRRSAMLGLIMYAVIAVPVFTPSGMTVLGLISLLVVVALALAGSLLARKYPADAVDSSGSYVHALVGTGVAAVLLIAAGQTLALVGRVDPRVMVIVVGVVAALLVAGQGLVASSKISSFTMWLLIVPILIALALGFLLGNVPVVIAPIRIVDGAPYVAILATAVAVFVLGWVDNSLVASNRIAKWSPIRVLVWTFVVLVLVIVGLLMFFGGAIFAPSLEFFVIPANIDAVPGFGGLVMAILTVLFSALVANALVAVGSLGAQTNPQLETNVDSDPVELETSDPAFAVAPAWVWISAVIAIVIALVDPGAQDVLVGTALIAAGLVGAQVSGGNRSRGAVAGFVVAVIAVVVLGLMGQMDLGWGSIIATVVVAAIAFVIGRSDRPDVPAPVEDSVAAG